MTIEQLAELPDFRLKEVGMGGYEDQALAKAFIEKSRKDYAKDEIEAIKKQQALKDDEIAELKKELEKLSKMALSRKQN